MEQLQQEVKEAEAVVAENTAAVHQQQTAVNAAIQAAQQATAEVRFIDYYTERKEVVDLFSNILEFYLQQYLSNLQFDKYKLLIRF